MGARQSSTSSQPQYTGGEITAIQQKDASKEQKLVADLIRVQDEIAYGYNHQPPFDMQHMMTHPHEYTFAQRSGVVEQIKAPRQAPPPQAAQATGWEMYRDPVDAKPYWHNSRTGETTWEKPFY